MNTSQPLRSMSPNVRDCFECPSPTLVKHKKINVIAKKVAYKKMCQVWSAANESPGDWDSEQTKQPNKTYGVKVVKKQNYVLPYVSTTNSTTCDTTTFSDTKTSQSRIEKAEQ